MAQMPEPLNTTRSAIFAGYEREAEDGRRPHLGASLIGKSCERSLWYTFRWALAKQFDGRMLRLFESGHLAEPRVIANLTRAGLEVHALDAAGGQWRISDHGGHFGGSMDGACMGVIEAPKTWHVLEIKTSNQKGFDAMLKLGVAKSKPVHYAQMQVYMGQTGMERALYVMVCKNNDDIHVERVEFDAVEFSRLMAKALRVIDATEPPLRISEDPSWYECKMCDHAPVCHGTEAPDVNCRTCAHSTPELRGDAGRWQCAQHDGADIPMATQRTGCKTHRYIPITLAKFATPADFRDGDVVYNSLSGGQFANGDGTDGTFSSHEIKACAGKATLPDMVDIKRQFATARVVA